MLTLRIVQAKFGDCLILIYGDKKKPKYMLIDGGPGGVYPDYLRPELKRIKEENGTIDLMVLSHIDGDHIVGLIDLTEELREQQADEIQPLIDIKSIWMNSFSNSIGKGNALTQAVQSLFSKIENVQSTMPQGDRAFQSINQGNTLRRNALLLNIPINEIVDGETISYNSVPDWVIMENIKIRIIGPNRENLDALKNEWEDWLRKNEGKIMMADAEILAYVDKSVPNLSSIMFLLEAGGKTILFTGDGRGDFILEGLEKTGLLDDKGQIHVDIFKVPHHGSIRDAREDFFLKVSADKYVISGDGRYGNPDFDTLKFIVDAAFANKKKIEIICTYETDSTKKLSKEYPREKYGYEIIYPKKGLNSLDIALA